MLPWKSVGELSTYLAEDPKWIFGQKLWQLYNPKLEYVLPPEPPLSSSRGGGGRGAPMMTVASRDGDTGGSDAADRRREAARLRSGKYVCNSVTFGWSLPLPEYREKVKREIFTVPGYQALADIVPLLERVRDRNHVNRLFKECGQRKTGDDLDFWVDNLRRVGTDEFDRSVSETCHR